MIWMWHPKVGGIRVDYHKYNPWHWECVWLNGKLYVEYVGKSLLKLFDNNTLKVKKLEIRS